MMTPVIGEDVNKKHGLLEERISTDASVYA